MQNRLQITTTGLPAKPEAVTVVFADVSGKLTGEGARIWGETGLDFDRIAGATRFSGKPGQTIDIPAPAGLGADRLIVVGTGTVEDRKAASATARRDFGGSLFSRLQSAQADKALIVVDQTIFNAHDVGAMASGMTLKSFRFDRYKTDKAPEENGGKKPSMPEIVFALADKKAADAAIAAAEAVTEGILLARELIHEPPNHLGPEEFAARVAELSEQGLEVEILTDKDMHKLGMEALLAVAKGSPRPARMAVIQWHGGSKKQAPVAFVGKGVMFDSGGISIKPAASMQDMKGDMGGGAAVAGAMKAIALGKVKMNVVGIIGMVENMPDGNSYRPGDILKSMSGQTIEIVNTDAEGRLVLADALWYARQRFSPHFMVDIATLTGSISVVLGQEYAGLFSNSDDLSERLANAGVDTGEKLWRLPLGPYYDKLINSQFADIKNSGGRLGNASTAGQFLARFVGDTPWAHLDIAAMAFGAPPSDVNASWAPGFGVALLCQFVADLAKT